MGEPSVGFSSANVSQSLPRTLGRLVLLKLLARGGMGDVYLAATTGIEGAERPCVVKTVRRDHIHDGSFLARFLDEARVQAQLSHPGVAQVLEASTDENGEPYTVVEYVEGRSLADVRQRAIQLGSPIGWAEAVAIALEMAHALAHVHERSSSDGTPLGIVHRDLSPQNVMLGYGGDVKLIDFGTARGQNRRCHTVAGVVFAKPGYVAPEIARQEVGDGRIDLYALGIMLWELVSGKRFLAGDPQQHLEDSASNRVFVPKIAATVLAPPSLDDVIAKLTANDPDSRYPSASSVVIDLAQVLSQAPPSTTAERGVRARVAALMRGLWPHEPGRTRADFAKLQRASKELKRESITPPAAEVTEGSVSRKLPQDPDLLPGTPYRLGRKIGDGSSGVVYEAEHVDLGRKLAVKVLSADLSASGEAAERFRREARAVANLTHPNIVALYDFGKAFDGRIFIAMELLTGEPLDRRLKRFGRLPWREAVVLTIEACRALEAAHEKGVVHRDLKPANLFLTQLGGLKLLDFGIAMALGEQKQVDGEKARRGFAIFGTPDYMAPEQVAGEQVDARCDVYALGCVLYELITGLHVFEGESSVVVLGKQLRDAPVPPRKRVSSLDIPDALETVILEALIKERDERIPSAAAIRERLELVLNPAKRRATFAKSALAAAALAGTALGAWSFVSTPAVLATATERASRSPTSIAAVDAPANPAEFTGEAPDETRVAHDHGTPVAQSVTLEVATVAKLPPAPSRGEVQRQERQRALEGAREHARGDMNDPRALRQWAQAAHKAGELREAGRAASVWALHDGTIEPRLFLANVLDATGRQTEAKAVLSEWIEAHPDSTDAWAMLDRIANSPGSAGAKSEVARK